MKKFLFFITVMCIFIPNIYGLQNECNKNEYNDLKKIVKNVKINYIYDEIDDYTITLSNMDSNIYAIDQFGLKYEVDSTDIVSVNPYLVGNYYLPSLSNYALTFYASEKTNCVNEKINLVVSIVPKYNEFSTSNECIKNKEHIYCAELIPFNLTKEEFEFKLSEYILFGSNTIIDINNKTVFEQATWQELLIGLILLLVGGIIVFIVIRWHNQLVDDKRAKRYSDIRKGKYNSGRIEDLINKK